MAMVSNLGMVMRNIYSSKYLKQFKARAHELSTQKTQRKKYLAH